MTLLRDSNALSHFSIILLFVVRDCCVAQMILNLETICPDDRANWLSAFHTVMSASGKKRVFDAETEQAQAQAQAQQQ